MNVIEFIKEKTETMQISNAEFRAKLEPKIRAWSGIINNKITNTLNNPWMARFSTTDTAGHQADETFVQTVEAEKMFKRLQTQLGKETYLGKWHLIDQECINQFADVTGDHQWIHTDPNRASKESPFKSTIAHGFLTLSLIPLLTDTVDPSKNPYPEAKMIVNYGLNRAQFPSPVKSGSRVRARTRLVEVIAMKKSIEVVNEVSIEIENRSRPACIAETVLRLYF